MRRLCLILAVPLFALGLLYAALPALAEYSVRNTLAGYGIETRQFILEHPRWNRISIRKLQLQRSTDQQQLSLTLQGINAHFSLWQLLSLKQIDQLRIDSLHLDLQSTAATQQNPSALPLVLPADILARLPADRINLTEYQLAFAMSGTTVNLNGTASADSESLSSLLHSPQLPGLELQIQASNNNRIIIQANQHNSEQLYSQLDLSHTDDHLSVDITNRLNSAFIHPLIQTPLLQQLIGETPLSLPLEQQLQQLSGELAVNGRSQLKLPLTDDDPLKDSHHNYQIQGNLQLDAPLPELASASIRFQAAAEISQQQFSLRVDRLNGRASELSTAGDTAVSAANIELELTPPLQISGPFQLSEPFFADQIQIAPASYTLSGPAITIREQNQPDQVLSYQPIALRLEQIDLATGRLAGSFSSDRLALQSAVRRWPALRLTNRFSFADQTFRNRFSIDLMEPLLPSGELNIRGWTRTQLDTNRTTAHWNTAAIPLQGIEKLARRYVDNLPPELTVHTGEFRQQGWLDLTQSSFALRLLNKATDTSLSYDQTRLFDLHWDSESVKSHQSTLSDKGQIRVGLIDAGAPLENFSGSYRFRQNRSGKQQLSLDSSTIELLGGRVTTLPVSFDPQQPEFASAIAVTQIELEKLLELEQQEGLTGYGILNGQMPVTVSQGELTITDGQINSAPEGGWIRFEPPPQFLAMTKTNPALGIAFDALRNFQYQSLGIELDYLEDGTALLNTRLQGNNPDWNNGQPVDFTVRIEENIPKLIQALQFTDKLTETLEKRYR